jgi:hypothetical protein
MILINKLLANVSALNASFPNGFLLKSLANVYTNGFYFQNR